MSGKYNTCTRTGGGFVARDEARGCVSGESRASARETASWINAPHWRRAANVSHLHKYKEDTIRRACVCIYIYIYVCIYICIYIYIYI